MKKVIVVFMLMAGFFLSSTQSRAQSNDTLMIKTSAVCGECKDIIERYLSFEKGISYSSLDVPSKMLTVVYNPKKTDPMKIRTAVTHSGYDADSLKADPKAFRKLPECCKKPHGE